LPFLTVSKILVEASRLSSLKEPSSLRPDPCFNSSFRPSRYLDNSAESTLTWSAFGAHFAACSLYWASFFFCSKDL